MPAHRTTARILCLAIVLTLAPWPGWARGTDSPRFGQARSNVILPDDGEPRSPLPIDLEMHEDPVIFRLQLSRFLDELETALDLAMEQLLVDQDPGARFQQQGIAIRLDGLRNALEDLDHANLSLVREELQQFPELLALPGELQAALQDAAGSFKADDGICTLAGQPEAFPRRIRAFKVVVHSLNITALTVAAVADVLSETGNPNFTIIAIVVRGIAEVAAESFDLTITVLENKLEARDECRTTLCSEDPTAAARGKGCDQVNNDCDAETDEKDEDLFAPDVSIARAGIRQCYRTEEAAATAIRRLSSASDDCDGSPLTINTATDPNGCLDPLTINTATDPNGCEVTVKALAADKNDNEGCDSVPVLVDGTVPEVSCAVATGLLVPANNAMRDVGLFLDWSDNCGTPDVEIEVTSDEPTATGSSGNAAPDAEVVRDETGQPVGLRLRAQRVGLNGGGDGRVYQIRVTATDECGLQNSAVCVVQVPLSPSGSAKNSGQLFDATEVN